MSWHFSQALVEEFSRANSSDGEPFAPWKSIPSVPDDYSSAKMKATCHRSPFGTMFVPSTDTRGEDLLAWFRAAFPVRISVPRAEEKDSTANAAGFGSNLPASYLKLDRSTHSWKTRLSLENVACPESSPILPKSGTMRNGECWEQETLEHPTNGKGCGLLPTPTATDWKRTPMKQSYANRPQTEGCPDDLAKWAVRNSGIPHARLVPDLWEWTMAWPRMWTASAPLETDKFRQWLQQHGMYCSSESTVDFLADL